MSTTDLLFELGTEELPAGDIDSMVKLCTTPITKSSARPISSFVITAKTANKVNQVIANEIMKVAGLRAPPVTAIKIDPTKAPDA